MRPFLTIALISGLMIGFVGVHTGQTEDSVTQNTESKTKDEKKSSKKKKKAAAERVTRRLPNNYGKLELSDEQKEKIYGIQASYRDEIRKLQDELKKLRDKQDTEIQGVLTSAQKSMLKELTDEDAKSEKEATPKKRAKRKKSSDSDDT